MGITDSQFDTQLVSVLYRTHKGLPASSKISSLYVFDALARAAKHQAVKRNMSANSAKGNPATFMSKLEGILEDLFADLVATTSTVPELKVCGSSSISQLTTLLSDDYLRSYLHGFTRHAVSRMRTLYECLYLIVIPLRAFTHMSARFLRIRRAMRATIPRHVRQDKMKKVLDLWSKNSTFPAQYLAKLKGLVSGGDYLTAQGAYNFEHPSPVHSSILYHVRICITPRASVDCPYTIERHVTAVFRAHPFFVIFNFAREKKLRDLPGVVEPPFFI